MGGMDKGLIELAGRPMIEYVIDVLSPQVDELLINANRSQSRYLAYGFPVFEDAVTGFAGPLAGIAAAIDHAASDMILTVPCDGPWLPADLAVRLEQRLLKEDADICIAHDGNRKQPVFGLFHRRVVTSINNFLEAGDRKLQLWLSTQKFAVEDFSDHPNAFINVNTPKEKARVEEILRSP
ncbi:molybdenum cofactor guanylyltransferase [Solemya velesiana gill symbiont]|uniref:Molybdenum cofactor guanylyltransferase n=2 Tax=Solemya velesiana gill symbiont TaxID=1918948 RepID=A0A1T2KWB3_9GAMM|nr:molybdenum cofactor guanylyltransferase [Solemya velesiana gill symbiont]